MVDLSTLKHLIHNYEDREDAAFIHVKKLKRLDMLGLFFIVMGISFVLAAFESEVLFQAEMTLEAQDELAKAVRKTFLSLKKEKSEE